jgi:arylsulfatase A-like enzyme
VELRNILCLVVDRWQAAQVGAYGNTWIRTPQLDRLAAESILFERAVADTLELERLYRGWWHGLPALWPEDVAAGQPEISALAAQAGLRTILLTDDPVVAALPGSAGFAERTLIASSEPELPADDIGETQAARIVGAAGEWLASVEQPFFLWLHARGMSGPWDAPYELRSQYADEEDPAPPRFVAPPCLKLPADYDPDQLLGVLHAYAGQVSLWDTCLGALIDELRAGPLAQNTLVVFLSPRGYPLGEHGRVGPLGHALYNESVQVPWLMRFPDGLGALARSQGLVLPADLPATLADWLGRPQERSHGGHSLMPLVRWEAPSVRECVPLASGGQDWAVRTPAWHLRVSDSSASRHGELYAKPSDRYEVNDVADRASDIVAGLWDVLDKARAQPTVEPTGLDAVLLEAVE